MATRMTKKLKSFSSIYHMPIGSQFANFPTRCNRTLNISTYAKTCSKFKMETNKNYKHNIAHVYYICYTSWPAVQSNLKTFMAFKGLRLEDIRMFGLNMLKVEGLAKWNRTTTVLFTTQTFHKTPHISQDRTPTNWHTNHQVLKINHQVKKVKNTNFCTGYTPVN